MCVRMHMYTHIKLHKKAKGTNVSFDIRSEHSLF